jgi:hypothetical protein
MNKFWLFLAILPLPVNADADLWATNSQVLKQTDDSISWISPDGRTRIQSDEDRAVLVIGRSSINIDDVMNPGLTEVNWLRPAGSLFINSSSGGTIGTWKTRVFVASGERHREVAVGKLIAKEASLTSTCRYLNVMSVAWLDGGKDLLVMQQVPNSSGCSHMGHAAFYVVDLTTERVKERLTIGDGAARYGQLLGPGVREIETPSLDGNR